MQEEIKKALDVLQKGGIILFPTDTVWGLGCDATNEKAVKRILEMINCTETQGMTVLVDNPGKILSYVEELPDVAWDLIEMSAKPLTIIYSGARNLAPNLLGEDKTVAIRVTNEVFSKSLCTRFRRPIVFASANRNGMPAPAGFDLISGEIKSEVDYAVDYRRAEKAQSDNSSIIKLGKGNLFKLIRE